MSHTLKKAVVYPIRNGNLLDSNTPLLMSLRSIEKHLKDDVPVFVISEMIPHGLSPDVLYVESKGYMDAMLTATTLAEEILWMNDDIYLLQDHTWDDLRPWVCAGDQSTEKKVSDLMSSKNKWRQRKGEVLNKLAAEGCTTFDFSTHTPYLYNSGILREVIRDYNFGYKTAIETAYGNVANVPQRGIECSLSRHHTRHLPVDLTPYRFLNHNDSGLTDHMLGFLLGNFPTPSKYEDHGICDMTKTLINEPK